MLEYEKKLHLDKQWEKMQQGNWYCWCYKLPLFVLEYALMYIASKWIADRIPDISAWSQSTEWLQLFGITFLKMDVVCFAIGFLVFLYGQIRLTSIISQNHSVKGENDEPDKLLTTGCYASLRHPMYGQFVICYASILLSLRSLVGMILFLVFCIFQYGNAILEEKKTLLAVFGKDYEAYIKEVPHILFRGYEKVVLLLLLCMNICGFLIR